MSNSFTQQLHHVLDGCACDVSGVDGQGLRMGSMRHGAQDPLTSISTRLTH